MRFMIIVKGNKDSEAGVMPSEQMFADMAQYHDCSMRRGCNRVPKAGASVTREESAA